jgi:hypothetical protein
MMTIEPRDVFVPGKFPLQYNNIYAHRGRPQDNFETAIGRGFVPVVFGSYGVGKSSLSRHCTKSWEAAGKLVYIESLYGKSLADIFTRVLEILGYEVTTETTSQNEKESGGESGFAVEGGILGYLKAKVAGKISRKRKKALGAKRQLVVTSPTDSKALGLCEDAGLFLMLDEAHRASDSLRRDLSAFLKAYANRNHEKFRIAVIGTETDASRLVIRDPGVDRLLQEVQVHPITEKEGRNILFDGMERLGIAVPEYLGVKVIKSGVGSPFVLQYLSLEMAEVARRDGATELSREMHSKALRAYSNAKAQRMIHQYRTAIETTGPKRYRKCVLHAMARAEDDYVTMEQLAKSVSGMLGDGVQSTALSGPLRELKTDKYGKILTDVEGPSGTARAYNYSAFSDPAMKSVIRMIEELAKPGEDIPVELQQEDGQGR